MSNEAKVIENDAMALVDRLTREYEDRVYKAAGERAVSLGRTNITVNDIWHAASAEHDHTPPITLSKERLHQIGQEAVEAMVRQLEATVPHTEESTEKGGAK